MIGFSQLAANISMDVNIIVKSNVDLLTLVTKQGLTIIYICRHSIAYCVFIIGSRLRPRVNNIDKCSITYLFPIHF